MKMYILFILFVLICNIDAKGLDSLTMAIKINNAIEYIKTDSLFQDYLVKNCSNELTFCLEDSTIYPIISRFMLKKLYYDLPNNKIEEYYQKIVKVESYYKKRKYINNIENKEIKQCNYRLILMEYEPLPELWGFYVQSIRCKDNCKQIFVYCIYDKCNNVIRAFSFKGNIN